MSRALVDLATSAYGNGMNVFFFGFGYSSRAAARALRGSDPAVTVAGTVRELADAIPDALAGLHEFSGTAPGKTLGPDLRQATHVVNSIPPGDGDDPVLAQHRADLDAATGLEWLCYFSTVGVYGDFGGALVDEAAETRPVNRRSQQRVVVEQAWRDYARSRGVPLLILRLAGIYGPGRSAFDKLRDGTARRIVKPGQVFNRIHVEDIGRITALAAAARLDGTFNLADDLPAPPQEVVAFAAGLLGVAPPPEIPFAEAQMTPMARSFYADNKRVANATIKSALGIDLLYPSYRDGLAAVLAHEKGSRMTKPHPAFTRPERVALDGRYVRIEPIGPQHADDLYAAITTADGIERFRWLPTDPPRDRADLAAWIDEVMPSEDPLYFAIIDKATGRCEGRQAFLRITPKDGVIEIGGVYWGPRMAKSRLATEALYLFGRHAFETLGNRRFEWKTNNRNEASKRAALRFGFTAEGVFRQHMIVKDENRDTAWFSMLDSEWPSRKAGLEAWLAPENFDADGVQRKKLAFS